MTRIAAQVHLDDGRAFTLGPGDVVGRLAGASVPINDPRISEVHAYVSLRGAELALLALRGTLLVDGIGASEVRMTPGLEVALGSEAHRLYVDAVHVPGEVLGVALGSGEPRPLVGDTLSVLPDGEVVAGLHPEGVARLWTSGDRWWGEAGGEAAPVEAGQAIGESAVRAVSLSVQAAGALPTQGRASHPPLHLDVRWDAAALTHLGAEPVVITGLPARLLSELVQLGGTAHWEVVAGELWADAPDVHTLRTRWDKTLGSLRRRLDRGGIRPGLVQSQGGIVQLVLKPQDSVASP